ncbi:MAG: threonine ammonia-lyase [Alphaproteobacteria bacterium]
MSVTFEDVLHARDKIKDSVVFTPTIKATRLSLHLGIDLYLKLENLQHTSAFKARGALNKLLTLDEEQRENGVIACSAGNHAQGLAYNATRLGIPSVIVMPNGTPFNKIKRTEDFGAKVILHGNGFEESVGETLRLAEEQNLTFIHPFDDEAVVAGQGTVGLEMLEQVPDLDVVVVPIGGGGLISGVATAVKGVKPEIEVIGAQAENFDAVLAMREGREFTGGDATLAEGIAVKAPSKKDFEIIEALVDDIYSASETEIEEAIFDLLSEEKLVAEGAPGAALAVIKKNLDRFKGKKVGMVLCGGNIDSRMLSTLILRGLVRDGRITRLIFEIDDTPGQLSDISRIIGESGANVVEVIHQRMMQTVSLKRAELEVVIEARDKLHVTDIIKTLEESGFKVSASRDV